MANLTQEERTLLLDLVRDRLDSLDDVESNVVKPSDKESSDLEHERKVLVDIREELEQGNLVDPADWASSLMSSLERNTEAPDYTVSLGRIANTIMGVVIDSNQDLGADREWTEAVIVEILTYLGIKPYSLNDKQGE